MNVTPDNADTEEGRPRWVICPVCEQANPFGALHCQHCWGASLYSATPVSEQELAVITERLRAREHRRNTIKVVSVAVLAPLMLALAVFAAIYSFTDAVLPPNPSVNSNSSPGQWSMFRRDFSRTGAVNPTAPAPQGTLKWSFQTGAAIHSTPTVVNGTVYFGSQDFGLYALDEQTGQQRWVFKAETWVQSSPAVVDGVVYFGSNDGHLYAVDADTGEELWRFYTRFPVKSSPAIADGMVFVGADDYSIYALDAKTGEKIWDYETGSFVMSSPVVANGIVYVGSMDQFLYALQADNGRFRLRVRAGEVMSSPAVRGDVVYYNSRTRLVAVDGKARNWPGEQDLRGWWIQFYAFRIAPVPPPISGLLWTIPRLGWSAISTPVVTDDKIYTTADNRMYRIDLEERTMEWAFSAGGSLRHSSPALGDDVLYIGSEDGSLYAVGEADGKELWSFPTGDRITSSPTLANGVVFVTSSDGKIYAIE